MAAKQGLDLLRLAGAQEAGVDEHAHQLLGDRFVQEERGRLPNRPRPRARRSPGQSPDLGA